MDRCDLVVVGGGAAGFYGAIACAEAAPHARVVILERSRRVLQKVRISGGGRCNVTHDTADARWLATNYPRGDRALIGPLHSFGPPDIVRWFAQRGVPLKTEADGRMFPTTDDSQTIIDCLRAAADDLGIALRTRRGVEAVRRDEDRFMLRCDGGDAVHADAVLLATGGTRAGGGGELARSLGHRLSPPVPSLFTLQIDDPLLRDLPGIAVEDVVVSAAGVAPQRGAVVVTHWGLSGPGVLRLSAWGARAFAERDYDFAVQVNWLPAVDAAQRLTEFASDTTWGKRQVAARTPFDALPKRLWQRLVAHVGVREHTWAELPRRLRARLAEQLNGTTLPVRGQTVNKDEFVTCGGVDLDEVDMRTMHSKRCDGLYFAGELLDVDGVTGGFNFQNAWTTGHLAGRAIAARLQETAVTPVLRG